MLQLIKLIKSKDDKRISFLKNILYTIKYKCKIIAGKKAKIKIQNGGQLNIKIGNDCAISWNVVIADNDGHKIIRNNTVSNQCSDVIIGDNVYSIILKGVRIADNSIVGANTLVTKNIFENTLNVGTPNSKLYDNVTWEL